MSRNLFVRKKFTMHSGDPGFWKIECDALTKKDIKTLAYIISQSIKFKKVIGVPKGGLKIAKALEKYKSDKGCCLIVDDVLTTGNSMEEARKKCGNDVVIGVVLFARGTCPYWVFSVFKLGL